MPPSNDAPIAMVDDSEGDRVLVEEGLALSDLDNPLLPFEDGNEFLQYLDRVDEGREVMPALVLLDINMPGMTGHEVLRRIRTRRAQPVVFMLSSSDDPQDKQLAEEVGAAGFVRKPNGIARYAEFFDSLRGHAAGSLL